MLIQIYWGGEFFVSELWPNLVTIHFINISSLSWERGQNQTLVPWETVHFVSRESQEVRENQN